MPPSRKTHKRVKKEIDLYGLFDGYSPERAIESIKKFLVYENARFEIEYNYDSYIHYDAPYTEKELEENKRKAKLEREKKAKQKLEAEMEERRILVALSKKFNIELPSDFNEETEKES